MPGSSIEWTRTCRGGLAPSRLKSSFLYGRMYVCMYVCMYVLNTSVLKLQFCSQLIKLLSIVLTVFSYDSLCIH